MPQPARWAAATTGATSGPYSQIRDWGRQFGGLLMRGFWLQHAWSIMLIAWRRWTRIPQGVLESNMLESNMLQRMMMNLVGVGAVAQDWQGLCWTVACEPGS